MPNDLEALATLIYKQGLPSRYSLTLDEARELASVILADGWQRLAAR